MPSPNRERGRVIVSALALLALFPLAVVANTFDSGSLIIPMDTDYQDYGMFEAYGLVYQLLSAGVPVHWSILEGKGIADPDFTASAVDHQSGAAVTDHGYRGGPFIIAASDAAQALGLVDDWQSDHATTVHEATASFDAPVARLLECAPRIAVLVDAHEDIAFDYLNAAGIPDFSGQDWPLAVDPLGQYPGYPDILSLDEAAGPDLVDPEDGALFDGNGDPVYCQVITMHWSVWDPGGEDAARNDGVVAELREFLSRPTHLFAECQSVVAIENSSNGHLLTPGGLVAGTRPSAVERFHSDYAFAQADGPFASAGGSEPSFGLGPGGQYYDAGVVMISGAQSPAGTRDVWMTGYLDGLCPMSYGEDCEDPPGKISYLGGHAYGTTLPISANPGCQGTRLFLNSLFEAPCTPSSCLGLAGVPSESGARARLTRSFPNPFGPTTTIRFVLPEAGLVELDVYSLDGRHVANLVNETRPAGSYAEVWDGSDDAGRQAPPGAYFYRLRAGSVSETKRMILVR
jgi:hypothetical protein